MTQWSRHLASEDQVSDVYVRLGYEFNIACRAFAAINVDTSDLGNVPEALRNILESTLSQQASVESLEKYLPRIRDIIINLLHGLKRKQQKLRQKQARDGTIQSLEGQQPTRASSSNSSVASGSTGLTNLLNQGIAGGFRTDSFETENKAGSELLSTRGSSRREAPQPPSRESSSSELSTMSSQTMQTIPVVPPYPGDETMPAVPVVTETMADAFPPPPPPPKQQQNALAALQRGGDLERRASRRYSAYQISKQLGAPPSGVPMLPPAQNSPIPNRGRNAARESMRAVQTRENRRTGAVIAPESSPSRNAQNFQDTPQFPKPDQGDDTADSSSPVLKTPDDKIRRPSAFEAPSATMQGPPTDIMPMWVDSPVLERTKPEFPNAPKHEDTETKTEVKKEEEVAVLTEAIPLPPPRQPSPQKHFVAEKTPPPDKELIIFLQYKTKVKKFVLPDGYEALSIARLQLAFIEKFAWNTHNNGVDLPEIYIQDPVSGVRHELEDLSDVKDRSVLVLNIEVLDEVKRHIDDGMDGLKRIIEGVRTVVDDQQTALQRVSDRQQDAAKEMARLATMPQPTLRSTDVPRINGTFNSFKSSPGQLSEIQSLRRDLAVLRQTYSSFQADIQSSMTTIRSKAASVKSTAVKANLPDLTGERGRAYLNSGKEALNEDSDKLVSKVDDLQDLVEDLRKDVVIRGVRPLPRLLETVAKDISLATVELNKMKENLKRERPIWTKIWEKELETVCTDREELSLQEDLAADLEDDLDKAMQTFALVEQATKEQLKDAPGSSGNRAQPRALNHVTPADPTVARDGVLGEVRALKPNHENRLDAIERAEKLRKKELESRRGGEFQKELGNFVEEGKLKKSGGFEEAERARKAKDERIRREVWERQNGMTQADASFVEPDSAPADDTSDSVAAEETSISPEEPVAKDANGAPPDF